MSENGATRSGHSYTAAYRSAQLAMAESKAAILSVVVASGSRGRRNVEVSRSLGIDHGYPQDGGGEEHRGHILSVLLHELSREGLVEQVDGRWVAAGGS